MTDRQNQASSVSTRYVHAFLVHSDRGDPLPRQCSPQEPQSFCASPHFHVNPVSLCDLTMKLRLIASRCRSESPFGDSDTFRHLLRCMKKIQHLHIRCTHTSKIAMEFRSICDDIGVAVNPAHDARQLYLLEWWKRGLICRCSCHCSRVLTRT